MFYVLRHHAAFENGNKWDSAFGKAPDLDRRGNIQIIAYHQGKGVVVDGSGGPIVMRTPTAHTLLFGKKLSMLELCSTYKDFLNNPRFPGRISPPSCEYIILISY